MTPQNDQGDKSSKSLMFYYENKSMWANMIEQCWFFHHLLKRLWHNEEISFMFKKCSYPMRYTGLYVLIQEWAMVIQTFGTKKLF